MSPSISFEIPKSIIFSILYTSTYYSLKCTIDYFRDSLVSVIHWQLTYLKDRISSLTIKKILNLPSSGLNSIPYLDIQNIHFQSFDSPHITLNIYKKKNLYSALSSSALKCNPWTLRIEPLIFNHGTEFLSRILNFLGMWLLAPQQIRERFN